MNNSADTATPDSAAHDAGAASPVPPASARSGLGEAVSVRLKVPFHDCDPLFVVWHGRYFEYLEIARSALFARHRVDVEHVRELNYRMYVTDAHCRYLHPLSYNDELSVTARFTAVIPLIRVAYDVRNLSVNRKSARAVTVLATTDAQGKLLPETPHDLVARIRSV
jgi:acyl-CoA thioester hydrolase